VWQTPAPAIATGLTFHGEATALSDAPFTIEPRGAPGIPIAGPPLAREGLTGVPNLYEPGSTLLSTRHLLTEPGTRPAGAHSADGFIRPLAVRGLGAFLGEKAGLTVLLLPYQGVTDIAIGRRRQTLVAREVAEALHALLRRILVEAQPSRAERPFVLEVGGLSYLPIRTIVLARGAHAGLLVADLSTARLPMAQRLSVGLGVILLAHAAAAGDPQQRDQHERTRVLRCRVHHAS
jgi:hypothetical protein